DIEKVNRVLDRDLPDYMLHENRERMQRILAGRLGQFYGYASEVLRQKHQQRMHNSFSQSLGRLLTVRNRARELLDATLAPVGSDSREMLDTVDQMKTAVNQLQDEAVALQVLIKTFKAQG
ncbi:MAG TPA: hypothetical protein VK829_07545, partial [Terriglobales bacterium]|nr:hypothetical protein [Terriglobales bacterium]